MAYARLVGGVEGPVREVNELFGRDPAGVPRWVRVETRSGAWVAGYVAEWFDWYEEEEAA
jgi:hypothetical protein